jgi:hypothetical protein
MRVGPKKQRAMRGLEGRSIVFSRFFFAYFLCSNDKESKDGVSKYNCYKCKITS